MEPVNLKHLLYNSYRIVCLFMFDHEILPLNMFGSFFCISIFSIIVCLFLIFVTLGSKVFVQEGYCCVAIFIA